MVLKMNKKELYTTIGFLLFAGGLTSIILNIVGVEWILLKWMNALPGYIGFLLKLLMIITGIIMIYFHQVDWRNVDDEEGK
jgi:hypothetical protein